MNRKKPAGSTRLELAPTPAPTGGVSSSVNADDTREVYRKKIAEWTQELERHKTIALEARTNIDRCEGGILAVSILLQELDGKT